MTTLEKIRAEIEEKQKNTIDWSRSAGLIDALDIIDKYAEQEPIRCKDCIHNNNCDIQYHAQAGDMFYCGMAEMRKLPSVRPQEQTGHWINMEISINGDMSAECDKCGCIVRNSFTNNAINYCPNCGARMVEPQESEEESEED